MKNHLTVSSDETRWVADDIHVSVEDGRDVLTGTVNFWSEHEAASTVASGYRMQHELPLEAVTVARRRA